MVRMRSPVRSRQLASFVSSFLGTVFFLTNYCPCSKIKSAMSRYVARATIAQRRSLTQERTLRNCVNRFLTWRCLSCFLVLQKAFFLILLYSTTKKPITQARTLEVIGFYFLINVLCGYALCLYDLLHQVAHLLR